MSAGPAASTARQRLVVQKEATMDSSGTLKVAPRGERDIVMKRVFDAPRTLVFEAWTRPDILKRWYGPPDWNLVVCDVDLRVGGSYRFVLRGPDGTEMGMRGVYREVSPPERLVNTETFDAPWDMGESLITATYTEHGGKTTLTATLRFESKQARDAVLNSNMEKGAGASYERLAILLTGLQARENLQAGP